MGWLMYCVIFGMVPRSFASLRMTGVSGFGISNRGEERRDD
jgi:hypothetical protein